MEREDFFSGYCRCIDASRMVALVTIDGRIDEVDCNYENCPYKNECQIAKKIDEFLEK